MYFKSQVELSTMYRNMEKQKPFYTAESAIEAIRKGYFFQIYLLFFLTGSGVATGWKLLQLFYPRIPA